jgi:hypothetical protein
MSYYNTTNETGTDLMLSHQKVKSQDDAIYQYFVSTGKALSPSMVLNELGLNCPITSVRRAICSLTKQGKIFKTKQTTMGIYGKKESLWVLKGPDQQIDLLQTVASYTHDRITETY